MSWLSIYLFGFTLKLLLLNLLVGFFFLVFFWGGLWGLFLFPLNLFLCIFYFVFSHCIHPFSFFFFLKTALTVTVLIWGGGSFIEIFYLLGNFPGVSVCFLFLFFRRDDSFSCVCITPTSCQGLLRISSLFEFIFFI